MGSSLKARPAATLPRGAFWADLGGFAAGLICVCGFSWLLRLTASMGWRQVRAIPTVHGGGFGFPKPKAFPFGIQCHILYGFYRSAEKRNHRRREELLVTQPLGLAPHTSQAGKSRKGGTLHWNRYNSRCLRSSLPVTSARGRADTGHTATQPQLTQLSAARRARAQSAEDPRHPRKKPA